MSEDFCVSEYEHTSSAKSRDLPWANIPHINFDQSSVGPKNGSLLSTNTRPCLFQHTIPLRSSSSRNHVTALMVNSVGVIGCGVIGASWTTLFLWQDLNVVATDPAPGAELRLLEMIKKSWKSLESLHAPKRIPFELLNFVPDIVPFLSEVDFVQEVSPF